MKAEPARRDFLLALPGWFPFFRRRRRATLAGLHFEVLRRGRSGTRYLLIHGDEETAREVLTAHMRQYPGAAWLVEGRARHVAVPGGVIDPNRLFSREGAGKSLRSLNAGWSEGQLQAALDRLDRLRPELVEALTPPPGELLFALHNNTAGYSVRDEVPISDETSLRDPDNPHEFFLCATPQDYAALARSPYNVVLQSRKPPEDDGSLSRLAWRIVCNLDPWQPVVKAARDRAARTGLESEA